MEKKNIKNKGYDIQQTKIEFGKSHLKTVPHNVYEIKEFNNCLKSNVININSRELIYRKILNRSMK